MRRVDWRRPMLLAGALLVACGDDDGGPNDSDATIAYGVTPDNNLVRFDVTEPGSVRSVAITGLGAGEAIRAIDFRVTDGALYGIGSDGVVYTINRSSGAATAISDTLPPIATGSTFGFDWNPTVDRLRAITDADSNLRFDQNTGLLAATDQNVAFAIGDVNFMDNPSIVAAAYWNNTDTATTTVLYALDQGNNALVTVVPPNAGLLNSIGGLGVDITGDVGFDIAPDGTAYAALVIAGSSTPSLYTIDLSTGAATLVGPIAAARVTGLSIRP